MSRNEKKFDAVAMMRSIRDRISAHIDGMTLEEELTWLAAQDLKDPLLARLREKATQQADPQVMLRVADRRHRLQARTDEHDPQSGCGDRNDSRMSRKGDSGW
jgi:hypothetical protein